MEKLIQSILTKTWIKLGNESLRSFQDRNLPGVYLLAWTDNEIENTRPKISDIFYVGMSNAKGGVKGRLKQFINGIEKNTSHSAGMRFFKEYCHNKPFSSTNSIKNFYFIPQCLKCNVTKEERTPNDLQTMGEVARLEYYLLAHIKENNKNEPELNKK